MKTENEESKKAHPKISDRAGGPGREIAMRLKAAAVEGRVKCADAFAIARECGVGRAMVGRVANEIRIKISDCQLGCF